MGYFSEQDILHRSESDYQPVRPNRRATKALGIVSRQECELQDNGTWKVRDTQTGSGQAHFVTSETCDCYDSRKGVCKHQIACRKAEAELTAYAADWDATVATAKGPTCPTCGSATKTEQHYAGGCYRWFASCVRNPEHQAVKL